MPDRLGDITAWLAKEAARAAPLAQSVSLAVRIEPELLRAIRLQLHPQLNVEAESAVWFSPLVEARNPLGFVFRLEALPLLREALRQDPQRLQQAWRISSAQHRGISPAVALEERLTWRALTQPPPGPAWDNWKRELEEDLQSVLAGLVRQNRLGLANWAARALPRLPEMPAHADLLEDLAHAAMLRGKPPIAIAGRMVSGLAKAWVAAGSSLVSVAVEFTPYSFVNFQPVEGRLRFFYPAPSGTPAEIKVPSGPAVRLSLGWLDTVPRQQTLTIEQQRLLEFPLQAREVTIATETGEVFRFAAPPKARQPWTVYLSQLSPLDSDLSGLIFEHLQAEGFDVALGPSPGAVSTTNTREKLQTRDFLVLISADPHIELTGFIDSMVTCETIIWCQTQPTVSYEVRFSSKSYEGPVSFLDRENWTTSLGQLLRILQQGPPPFAHLDGVPELPAYYLPRPTVLAGILAAMDSTTALMIALEGGPGAGQGVIATAVARNCAIRRRFVSGGVHWPHDIVSWPDPGLQQLVIVDRPDRAHYEALAQTARDFGKSGSRILVIHAVVDELDPSVTVRIPVPYLTRDEIREGLAELPNFGLNSEAVLGLIGRVTEGRPKYVSMLQRAFTGMVITPEAAGIVAEIVGSLSEAGAEELAKAREWIDCADILFGLAIFKPETPITQNALNLVWQNVVGQDGKTGWNAVPQRALSFEILTRQKLLTQVDPQSFQLDTRIPTVLSGSPMTASLESQLINYNEAQCNGDWVSGLGDQYFAHALSYHLARTGRQDSLRDLLLDLDFFDIRLKLDGRAGLLEDLGRVIPAPPWAAEFSSYLSRGSGSDVVFLSPGSASSPEMVQLGARSAHRQQLEEGRPYASVLVAGTGSYQLPDPVLWMAEYVGRELARKGFGLITGGWQGVDYVTADAYILELRRIGAPESVLVQVAEGNSKPDYPGGTTVVASDGISEAVARAQAVVLLGGVGGTARVGEKAMRQQRPIWAPAGTGGDAADPRWRQSEFDGLIKSRRDAFELARKIVEAIGLSLTGRYANVA